jgi:formate dehydrogenase subunit gamma
VKQSILDSGTQLRFVRTVRALHWAYAMPFLILLLTGAALYLPGINAFGRRDLIRPLHLVAAAALVLAPAAVYVLGDRRAIRREADQIDRWSASDVRWLRVWLGYHKPDREEQLPPAGRFNAGQKLNSVFSLAMGVGLLATGLVMVLGHQFRGPTAQAANLLHDLLFLAALPLVAGHIWLSALKDDTRPGLSGMIGGRVSREWLRKHHPAAPDR